MANPIILYDSMLTTAASITATDTLSGYSVLNIKDYRPYTYWIANTIGVKYITIDNGIGVSYTADCLGLAGHNLYSISAIVSVESSTDGSNWIQRLSPFVPTSNKALIKPFDSASARYWRVKVNGQFGLARIGVLFLGKRLTFPYPPDVPFIPFSEAIEVETKRSKTGNILGSVVRYKPITINAKFSNLDRNWVLNNFKPFWDNHASNLLPFFWAWDIDYSSFDVFYVTIDEGSKYETPLSNLSFVDSISLEMRGVKE